MNSYQKENQMIESEKIELQKQEFEKMMEENSKQAYLHGGKNAHEYMASINKHDLADLTPDEWLTFCECMCKSYHQKFIELENM